MKFHFFCWRILFLQRLMKINRLQRNDTVHCRHTKLRRRLRIELTDAPRAWNLYAQLNKLQSDMKSNFLNTGEEKTGVISALKY